MSQNLKGSTYRAINFGLVARRAAATVPQSASQTIFTASGAVVITGLTGYVTTAGSATDPLIKLRSTPTVGTVGDICAVAGTFTTSAIGTLLTIDGNPATAMAFAANGSGQLLDSRGIVLPAGALTLTTGASNATLAVAWTVLWVPLDDGANLVAA